MEIVIAVLVVIPFSVISYRLLSISLNDILNPWGRTALSLSMALGILSLVTFFLGIGQLLFPFAIWITVALIYGVSFLWAKVEYRLLGRQLATLGLSWKSQSRTNKTLIVLTLIFVSASLMGAYFPQTADDALYYHFALPKLFIQNGGLFFFPYNFFSLTPSNIEMLFTLGMLLKNEVVANVFNVLITIDFGLIVYALVREYLGHSQGLFWMTVFFSLPLTMRKTNLGYVDLGMGMFGLAAFYLLLMAIHKNQFSKRTAVFAGIFWGLSVGAKMNAGLTAMAACLAFLIVGSVFRIRKTLVFSLILGLATLAVVCPWSIRAAFHTGNPFYPAFNSTFKGTHWHPAFETRLKELNNKAFVASAPLGRSIEGLVLVPPHLFFPNIISELLGKEKEPSPRSPYQPPELDYLAVAFCPFSLLLARKRKEVRRSLVFVFISSALAIIPWYFLIAQEPRYLSPLFGIFFLCGGLGLTYLFSELRNRTVKGVSLAISIIWFASSLGFYGLYYPTKAHAILHKEDYLMDYAPFYRSALWANKNLGKESRIAFLSEIGPYYFDMPYIHGGPSFEISVIHNHEDLYEALIREGVTHIFVAEEDRHLETGPYGTINPIIHASGLFYFSDQEKFNHFKGNRLIGELLLDKKKASLIHEVSEPILGRRTPRVVARTVHARFYELLGSVKKANNDRDTQS